MSKTTRWSVAGRIFAAQLVAILGIGGVLSVVLAIDAKAGADQDAAALSLAVSQTIAADPAVSAALRSTDPTAALQDYALDVVDSTGVDFITIMDPEGIRFTHPDASRIGQRFLGTIDAARQGETITETYTGTLGPSVRAVVPVMTDGQVVGIVSSGVTTSTVGETLLPRVPFVAGIAILVVAIGTVCAIFAWRGLQRVTGNLSTEHMQSILDFYESVLHSVREGVVLTDSQHRIVLYNDEAADLLGLPPAPARLSPRTAADAGIDGTVAEVLDSGRRVVEETHVAHDRVLLINQEPATRPGRTPRSGPSSSVMTLRDQSELQSLIGELESATMVGDALRAQAHDHANTLHTVAALIELERSSDAIALIARTTRASQGLADAILTDVSDPVFAAVLLAKAATAHERAIDLVLDIEAGLSLGLSPDHTVSVLGNLLDNAIEAVLTTEGARVVTVSLHRSPDSTSTILRVSDTGKGVREDIAGTLFLAGVTTKAEGHGIGLAVVRQIVEIHGGSVSITSASAETASSPTTVTVIVPDSDNEVAAPERQVRP